MLIFCMQPYIIYRQTTFWFFFFQSGMFLNLGIWFLEFKDLKIKMYITLGNLVLLFYSGSAYPVNTQTAELPFGTVPSHPINSQLWGSRMSNQVDFDTNIQAVLRGPALPGKFFWFCDTTYVKRLRDFREHSSWLQSCNQRDHALLWLPGSTRCS